MSRPRYKHKLNMLYPGGRMCLAIFALLALAGLSYALGWSTVAWISGGLALLTALVLTALLIVEQHQDRMMYLDAKREDPEIK